MKRLNLTIFFFFALFCWSCYKDDDYLPSHANYEGFLNLSASATTIPADGESSVFLYGELPIDIREDKTSITFTTTKGTFENGQKTITKAATVQVLNGANKRIAKVKLTSAATITQATVEATIGDITQTITIAFTTIDYASLFSLSAAPAQIPADGESYTVLTAEQPLDVKEEYTSVTFSTTKGTFENGQKTITKSSLINLENTVYRRKAIVRLVSSKKVDSADIEASVKGTSKKTTVYFVRAFPESIKLSTTGISISPGFGNSVVLTTTLLRRVGTASQGAPVKLESFDANNAKIGYFINYNEASDENGQTTNRFTLGDQNYRGSIKIVATAVDGENKPIRDSIQLTSL